MPPTIDKEKCIGCGSCVENCPGEVLELKDDIANVVRADDCVECGMCADSCPTEAVTL